MLLGGNLASQAWQQRLTFSPENDTGGQIRDSVPCSRKQFPDKKVVPEAQFWVSRGACVYVCEYSNAFMCLVGESRSVFLLSLVSVFGPRSCCFPGWLENYSAGTKRHRGREWSFTQHASFLQCLLLRFSRANGRGVLCFVCMGSGLLRWC